MDDDDSRIRRHFQDCIERGLRRQGPRHDHILSPNTAQVWLDTIDRVRTTFYTKRSVDRITREHRRAWSVALIGKDELTTHSFLRGDPFHPSLVDDATQALVDRAIGGVVLATPTLPWLDRLTWPLRSENQASVCDQAWRYWRYGEIVRWLTNPVTHLTETEKHLSLLIGVVLTHFGEEFASGNGPETAAHWHRLLVALGDGIMPVAYSSRAQTLTLARWQDLEGTSLPS